MASQSTHEDNKTAIDQMNEMLEGALDENRRHKEPARKLVMPTMGPSMQGKPAAGSNRGLAQRVTSQYFAQQEAMGQAESAGMER